MKKILLAGPFSDKAKRIMTEILRGFHVECITKEEEFEAHPDADYLIHRTLKMTADTLRKMKSLRFIQRWGVGLDMIDIQTAGKLGIVIAGAVGVNAPAVAELTVGLMLALYRNIVPIHEALHRGEWIKSAVEKQSYMINGKTVGVIGGGNIGMLVGRYVSAMNANVIIYDDFARSPETEAATGFRFVGLDDLLKTADIVTLHVPLMDSTRHMIDEPQFALMKPGAILVNAARGGIVNEKALLKALDEERIMGAALDCFETEPLPGDSPLLLHPRVLATCHVGGNSVDVANIMATWCPENVIAFVKGEMPDSRIANKEFLPKK
jgi:phosphoglycerate dehydrogenase-like enzyme